MAPHLGIGRYFNFTLDDWNNAALASLGVTLEQLKKDGVIDLGGKWKPVSPNSRPLAATGIRFSHVAGPESPGSAGVGGAACDAGQE